MITPPTADWQAEFDRYRATPQFEALNRDMTLAEFKTIFWWEWAHRQLGRAIGAVWALGFLWFALRRRLPTSWVPRLLALGLLGGLQGAIGWWMVRSGLAAGMTSVASYRLAIHLGLAFLILGLIAWYVLRLGRPEAELLQARRQRNPALMAWGSALVALVFAQVLLGALTVWKLLHFSVVTLHLGNALLFFAVLIAIAERAARLERRSGEDVARAPGAPRGRFVLASVATLAQTLLGGLVSTNHAGLACPDFPTCHGEWWPPLEGLVGTPSVELTRSR